jgi:hypothetical protein
MRYGFAPLPGPLVLRISGRGRAWLTGRAGRQSAGAELRRLENARRHLRQGLPSRAVDHLHRRVRSADRIGEAGRRRRDHRALHDQPRSRPQGPAVPLLRQEEGYPNDRPLFWHYPNHWGPKGPGIGPSSTIRRGDWKLFYYHAPRRYELFNLSGDGSDDTTVFHDHVSFVRRQMLQKPLRCLLSKASGRWI